MEITLAILLIVSPFAIFAIALAYLDLEARRELKDHSFLDR